MNADALDEEPGFRAEEQAVPAGGPAKKSGLPKVRGFRLYDDRPCAEAIAVADVSILELALVAGPRLAVDAKIGQR